MLSAHVSAMMWKFGSRCSSGSVGMKNVSKQSVVELGSSDSDKEVLSVAGKEEGLKCPICCESFNIVENVPYILWCGHTMCSNCISGLQWDVVKFPTLPVQLPLFISCPWCNLLSLRLVYKGELRFPRKNYFLRWMIESRNGNRVISRSTNHAETHSHHISRLTSNSSPPANRGANTNHRRRQTQNARPSVNSARTDSYGTSTAVNYLTMERLNTALQKSLVFFVHFIAKLPLVIVFLLIVIYAVPACAAILVIYILLTLVVALPSFLVLYYAYPGLDWLVAQIMA